MCTYNKYIHYIILLKSTLYIAVFLIFVFIQNLQPLIILLRLFKPDGIMELNDIYESQKEAIKAIGKSLKKSLELKISSFRYVSLL